MTASDKKAPRKMTTIRLSAEEEALVDAVAERLGIQSRAETFRQAVVRWANDLKIPRGGARNAGRSPKRQADTGD